MDRLKVSRLLPLLCIAFLAPFSLVNGQINTPCTGSMISSFTPCINFVTGSSNNGSSPTSTCCNALKSLMSTSMDCVCLVITASVPLPLPITRTLAISLPRACKMAGVPIQCKASGSPLPAPGPVLLGPTLPPPAASPLSPRASKAVAVATPPEIDTTEPPTPALSPAPATTARIRPVVTPSPSTGSYTCSSTLLLMFVAVMVFQVLMG